MPLFELQIWHAITTPSPFLEVRSLSSNIRVIAYLYFKPELQNPTKLPKTGFECSYNQETRVGSDMGNFHWQIYLRLLAINSWQLTHWKTSGKGLYFKRDWERVCKVLLQRKWLGSKEWTCFLKGRHTDKKNTFSRKKLHPSNFPESSLSYLGKHVSTSTSHTCSSAILEVFWSFIIVLLKAFCISSICFRYLKQKQHKDLKC